MQDGARATHRPLSRRMPGGGCHRWLLNPPPGQPPPQVPFRVFVHGSDFGLLAGLPAAPPCSQATKHRGNRSVPAVLQPVLPFARMGSPGLSREPHDRRGCSSPQVARTIWTVCAYKVSAARQVFRGPSRMGNPHLFPVEVWQPHCLCPPASRARGKKHRASPSTANCSRVHLRPLSKSPHPSWPLAPLACFGRPLGRKAGDTGGKSASGTVLLDLDPGQP